jgi:hypothetical protein
MVSVGRAISLLFAKGLDLARVVLPVDTVVTEQRTAPPTFAYLARVALGVPSVPMELAVKLSAVLDLDLVLVAALADTAVVEKTGVVQATVCLGIAIRTQAVRVLMVLVDPSLPATRHALGRNLVHVAATLATVVIPTIIVDLETVTLVLANEYYKLCITKLSSTLQYIS